MRPELGLIYPGLGICFSLFCSSLFCSKLKIALIALLKEWHEWFALSLSKNEQRALQIHIFPHVFNSFPMLFPFLCSRANCSHSDSEQFAPVALFKRATVAISSFPRGNRYLLFRSQKTSDLLEKPKSEFPTLNLSRALPNRRLSEGIAKACRPQSFHILETYTDPKAFWFCVTFLNQLWKILCL